MTSSRRLAQQLNEKCKERMVRCNPIHQRLCKAIDSGPTPQDYLLGIMLTITSVDMTLGSWGLSKSDERDWTGILWSTSRNQALLNIP